ncbi:MAG: sugar-binding protein [Thermoplasmatota archaeon]
MKKAVSIMFMISLLSVMPSEISDAGELTAFEEEKREADILYTTEPPVLDGRIGALEWQTEFASRYFDAFDLLSFREYYTGTGLDEEFTNQSDLSVTFYLLYDDTYLYFAANVTDDVIIVDSGSTFWRDDGIELLIDGAHDMDVDQRAGDPWPGYEDGTTLLALADGSLFYDYGAGTPYERVYGEDADWYGTVWTVPSSNFYNLEMRIRLDSISSPLPGSTIGLNVGVNDDDTGGTSKTALKWTGRETLANENPAFKNETLWGIGRLRSFVKAGLPSNLTFDEDEELRVSSNLSWGNHPDFDTMANYTWSVPIFEDGIWNNITIFGPEFVHTFDEPRASYQLRLTVTDPDNITDEAVTYIRIRDVTPPEIEENDGVALEEVPYTYFLNAADNVAISHVNWSLLDTLWFNETTESNAFVHTFMHPGNFTLHFSVFDTEGNRADGSAAISVIDNVPPIVGDFPDITMNTTASVLLNASGAWDDGPDGPETDLFFSWGLRSTYAVYDLQGRETELYIPVPGQYNATLTVTDRAGLSTLRNFNATVQDTTEPIIELFIPLEMNAGQEYGLDANATTDNDPLFWNGSSLTWKLHYEEGSEWSTTMEGPMITANFPIPGKGLIELTVMDPSGNTATAVHGVIVVDATPPELQVSLPEHIEQGQEFLIDITGSTDNVGLVSVHYSVVRNVSGEPEVVMSTPFFGIRIGNVSPEDYTEIEEMTIVLQDPGTYSLIIHVKDAAGLSSPEQQLSFKVWDNVPPRARLNTSLVVVNPGMMVYLSASQSTDEAGPVSFSWFVDGEEIDRHEAEFSWLPPRLGEFNVTVKVTDQDGNTGQASALVQVIEPAKDVEEKDPYLGIYVLWAAVLIFIILGTLLIYMWTRRKRKELAGIPEE